jgi:hypothetical protein
VHSIIIFRAGLFPRGKATNKLHSRFPAPRLRRCQRHLRRTLQWTALNDPPTNTGALLTVSLRFWKEFSCHLPPPIQTRRSFWSAWITELRYGQSPEWIGGRKIARPRKCWMWECDIPVTGVVNQSNVRNTCRNYCLILTPYLLTQWKYVSSTSKLYFDTR